jgi:hypothetical protein
MDPGFRKKNFGTRVFVIFVATKKDKTNFSPYSFVAVLDPSGFRDKRGGSATLLFNKDKILTTSALK